MVKVLKEKGAPGKSSAAKEGDIQKDFIYEFLHHPDQEEAAQMITQHAEHVFMSKHGATLETLKREIEHLTPRYQSLLHQVQDLEKSQKKTNPYKSEPPNHSAPAMNRKDRTLFCFLLSLLLVSMVIGAANIFSNLLASGEKVFIDNPALAVALSMLMPTGSASLKLCTNFMTHDSSRQLYSLCVTILTAFLLVAWTLQFAQQFTGIAGDVDWEALGEASSSGGPLFIGTQTLAEMFTATTIFLALENLWAKYHPWAHVINPQMTEINKQLASVKGPADELDSILAAKIGQLKQLEAEKQVYICEQKARFDSIRNRFQAFKNFK